MIAVSGGNGYLGRHLVERLAVDEPVVSIVRGSSKKEVGNCLEIGYENIGLADILKQARVFIHTAGKIRGGWAELKEANVDSVRFYKDILPKNIQRVIAFSSVNIFFRQTNDYGRSKWMAEEAWRSSPFVDRLTILRPSWIYGPGDTKNLLPLIRLVQKAPGILPIPGHGGVRPVYIEDIAELTVKLNQQGKGESETWIVSGTQMIRWQAMVQLIASLLGKKLVCLAVSNRLVDMVGRMVGGMGLNQVKQRLTSFTIDKPWHDSEVWQLLEREPVVLERGLQRSLEGYYS